MRYIRFGHLTGVQGILYGVKPVVIAVVLQALWRLGRTAVKTRFLACIGIAAAIANALGASPLSVLIGASILVVVCAVGDRRRVAVPLIAVLFPASAPTLPATIAAPVGLWPLFLVFLKIGSVVFGSGYVLLAFLRADFVERLHWLTEAQLIDAVAVGQVTPGPVFTTATFIGYLVAGPVGAIVATIAIFLPAFLLVALTAPFVPRLRRSPLAGAFLDGLNVASLALMLVVTWQLGRAAIVDPITATIAVAAALLLLVFRLNVTWLVLAGALTGAVTAIVR